MLQTTSILVAALATAVGVTAPEPDAATARHRAAKVHTAAQAAKAGSARAHPVGLAVPARKAAVAAAPARPSAPAYPGATVDAPTVYDNQDDYASCGCTGN